jgi:hypothetical protein
VLPFGILPIPQNRHLRYEELLDGHPRINLAAQLGLALQVFGLLMDRFVRANVLHVSCQVSPKNNSGQWLS